MHDLSLDQTDMALLRHLQRDASLSQSDLAKLVNLSPSQCSRRRLALEKSGIIEGYRAVLNGEQLGFHIEAFCRISLNAHSIHAADDFSRFLETLPDVRSAWAITGDADYLVHIHAQTLQEFGDLVHQKLLPHPNVGHVRSDLVLRRVTQDRGFTL